MTMIIRARNPHDALEKAIDVLVEDGYRENSRNGSVVRVDGPMTTVYSDPRERVVFHAWRDANPFFHFYESLWMLAGRRDIAPLTRYAKQLGEYSDDGVTQNAAYGYRWRRAENHRIPMWPADQRDQLVDIVRLLRENPATRQCVLQIWDHELDLGTTTKDHACNVAATFQVGRDSRLHMVVFCRSNDIIWGCYGANAVHFSVLLEYVATCAELQVGTYSQVSVNWHAYDKTLRPMLQRMSERDQQFERSANPYVADVRPYPLVSTSQESWDRDVRRFITDDGHAPRRVSVLSFKDPFFNEVALPIVRAHDCYRDLRDVSRYDQAALALEQCAPCDWKRACEEWLERRRDKEISK